MPIPAPPLSEILALWPEILLSLGACALLLFDLLTSRDRKAVLGWICFGVVMVTLGGHPPAPAAGRQHFWRHVPGRRLRGVLQGAVPDCRGADRIDFPALPGRRGHSPRGILRLGAVRHGRHDVHGRRRRLHHHLPGSGTDVAVNVRAGGLHPPRRRLDRGGGEVLPDGRLHLGNSALRTGAALWSDRHNQPGGGGAEPVGLVARQPGAGAGDHPGGGGLRLQDRRGAVPHVGAGHL